MLSAATSVRKSHAFRAHDANLFRVHIDALGERAQVVAAISTGSVRMRLRAWLAKVFSACGV
jgi:hypothetical protein